MKRTSIINLSTFRKNWRLAPVALAVSTVFMLSGCEKSDQNVILYKNADDCSQANPSMSAQCKASYENALKDAAKTAPKYASYEDCVAEFGEGKCTQAPSQAGLAPETGSFWMPLMAGYMMGRMMSGAGYQQQPLFSPKGGPAGGQFVDAAGKSYGPATATGRTVSVPNTAMTPKPATTTTITRGGFGETVARQSALQRSGMTANSNSSHRSMGG